MLAALTVASNRRVLPLWITLSISSRPLVTSQYAPSKVSLPVGDLHPHLIHDFLTPAVHPMHTVRHLDRIIRFLQGSQSWPTDTKTTLLTPRVALGRTCMICVRYGLIGLDCNPYRCRSFARIYPILNFWANPLGSRDDAKEQYCTELMQPLPNYWMSSRSKLSPIVNKYRDLIVPNRIVFSCVE